MLARSQSQRALLLVGQPLAKALADCLQGQGFSLLAVGSGREALEVLGEFPAIELGLIELADHDGAPAAQAAQMILGFRPLPLLFLSAHAGPAALAAVAAFPSYGFVCREGGPELLLAAVQTALRLHGLQQSLDQKAQQLQASEERYRDLFENANLAIFQSTPDGKVVAVNPTFARMFGYGSPAEFYALVDNAASIFADPQRRVEIVRLHASDPSITTFENRYRRKDGSVFPGRLNVRSIMDAEGNLVLFEGFIEDVTAFKQAEQALRASEERARAMLDAIPDLMFRQDRQGVFLDFKASASDLYAQSLPSIIGKQSREILPQAIADLGQRQIEVALETGQLQTFEYRLAIPERGIRSYEARMLASGPDEVISIVRDITEQKTTEARLKALVKEKELLLREVHHRIKNNMSTVCSMLAMQVDLQDDPAVVMALQDAESRVRNMMVLYDKLYLTRNYSALSLQEYLPSLLSEIVQIFPNSASVKVRTQIEDIALASNTLSPLGIILTELITNAMKHAFVGCSDGLITVTARRDAHKVVLTFEDNGCGVPESFSLTGAKGFGAQLIEVLVNQIDGSITVERNQGTKFVIEFAPPGYQAAARSGR
jgi:PAS domain S-box-containing protein